MPRKLWIVLAVSLALVASLGTVLTVGANPPAPDEAAYQGPAFDALDNLFPPANGAQTGKFVDQPNLKDLARMRERQRLLEAGQTADAASLALTGTDRVLVLLVDFAGTDVFTWTAGWSTWDPKAIVDPSEAVFDAEGQLIVGNCSKIITQTKVFAYTGPSFNEIDRPLSAADRSGDMVWTPNFNNQWYTDFMFGNGVTFNYTRTDGSEVNEDFLGKSVADFYNVMSGGTFNVNGDVIGPLSMEHSLMWYGADPCPGARSGAPGGFQHYGAIPGAGNARSLILDAIAQVNAISDTIPGFSWQNYDQDGDGVIDRLWLVHSGLGEEDSPTLLNRTDYGEGAM